MKPGQYAVRFLTPEKNAGCICRMVVATCSGAGAFCRSRNVADQLATETPFGSTCELETAQNSYAC
jgi:hypothetical protein